VVDEKAFADGRAGMNFDPGKEPVDFGKEPGQKRDTEVVKDMNKSVPENGRRPR